MGSKDSNNRKFSKLFLYNEIYQLTVKAIENFIDAITGVWTKMPADHLATSA